MPTITLISFLLAMFANAVVFSMMGQGGGVLYTPIQVFFGVDFHTAATTSLFLIVVTSFSSTMVFRKAKRVDWPMSLVLESATVAGAFLGGLCSGFISGKGLSAVFAVVLALAGLLMRAQRERAPMEQSFRSSMFNWHRQVNDNRYSVNLALALPISFVAGALSGLVGLAGGILKIPMMVLLFRVPMDIAVASSAFMVGLTASGGFAGHLVVGHFDWRFAAMLVIPVFLGGQIGARRALAVDRKKLRAGFVWFLFFVSALMFSRAFWGQ